MKTSELIRRLQIEDPTGEEEVSVENVDIFYVAKEPSYYDGCQQVLVRDLSRDDYNVVGMKIRSTGSKIQIRLHPIGWALLDSPDMPVEYDSDYSKRHYSAIVEKHRIENKKIIEEVENAITNEKCEPKRDTVNKQTKWWKLWERFGDWR